jgi:RecA/RadA recombinase
MYSTDLITGKTQFCMCCCASALIHSTPGSASAVSSTAAVGGGVLYFDTELKFSIDRLIEIISHQMPSRYNSEWAVDAPHRVQDLLKNLHLRRPVTCSELLHSIENIEDYVIEHRISLVRLLFLISSLLISPKIVIDSIASLAKKEGLNEQDKETYILRQVPPRSCSLLTSHTPL